MRRVEGSGLRRFRGLGVQGFRGLGVSCFGFRLSEVSREGFVCLQRASGEQSRPSGLRAVGLSGVRA